MNQHYKFQCRLPILNFIEIDLIPSGTNNSNGLTERQTDVMFQLHVTPRLF